MSGWDFVARLKFFDSTLARVESLSGWADVGAVSLAITPGGPLYPGRHFRKRFRPYVHSSEDIVEEVSRNLGPVGTQTEAL
jgi:hypothetical protein